MPRLICDRRLRNSLESAVNRVLLFAVAPLFLERSQTLSVHTTNTRCSFHLYKVDNSRWHTQVIGMLTCILFG